MAYLHVCFLGKLNVHVHMGGGLSRTKNSFSKITPRLFAGRIPAFAPYATWICRK